MDDIEFKFKNSKTYRNVLEHRRNCKKWGKEFCLECFGNGLVKTFSDFEDEFIKSWRDKTAP